MPAERKATLYRMVLADHECPFGVRARDLLEQSGYDIDEHILGTRDEVESFKAEHGVATTPQVFIDGERIGGSAEIAAYLEEQSTGA
jgi:glutaredoxin